MYEARDIPPKSRVVLTKEMLDDFFSRVFKGNVPELSATKGLTYDLVYNLVHGRIRSLSVGDYRVIFGVDPPRHAQKRVNARYFRGMVKLWLFLEGKDTEAELYREFNRGREFKKIDYRVFAGDKVRTVDARLERWMEQKFLSQGFGREEIENGIAEMKAGRYEEKIPYVNLKPLLEYLEQLGVSPTKVLNQWAARYESGELRNVPKGVYERALKVKAKAETVARTGSRYEVEKLKEEIYGRRKGFVLFSEVEEELKLLRKYGRKSLKKYLGRSIRNYQKGLLKRISEKRARKIQKDFELLFKQNPPVGLVSVPARHQAKVISGLLSVLCLGIVKRLIEGRNESYESTILQPSPQLLAEKEKTEARGFTPVGDVPEVLGMSREGFDRLLASHSDLFKRVGKYGGKWFFPDRYLEELFQKREFALVRVKYEWLARSQYGSQHRRTKPAAKAQEGEMSARSGASTTRIRDELHEALQVLSGCKGRISGKPLSTRPQEDLDRTAHEEAERTRAKRHEHQRGSAA
jgi:hypothetical protein